ncbi:MAG: hydroxymethylbilane synthase [Acidaminococcaceae bacterium]
MMKKSIVIGTRGSKLALWQAEHIAGRIRERFPAIEVTLKKIVTTGDKILDVPLAKIGGKGLFTKELENAMLSGDIDLAVHSLKDMPTELPEGLMLAAITTRADASDAFVSLGYKSLDELPKGAKVGTSSLRRRAQILKYRPDLQTVDLRGNLDTRIKKLENKEMDAIILATAGLKRLGLEQYITQILPAAICLPAVGQGALAIETRQDDAEVLSVLEFLNDNDTIAAVTAERAYLREVQGGCQVPVGVHGEVNGDQLLLEATILKIDGTREVRKQICGSCSEAEALGVKLAQQMLAAGGKEILDELIEY